jgi:tetratricopeptide (TPR) repeat protein
MQWIREIAQNVQSAMDNIQDNPTLALTNIETAFILFDSSVKASPWVPNRTRLMNFDGPYQSLKWRVLRGEALFKCGDMDQASFVAQKVLQEDSRFVDALLLRANIMYLQSLREIQDVITLLSNILSLDPDNTKARKLFKKIKSAEAIKKTGNDAFAQSDWNLALEKYTEYLETAQGIPKAKVLSNRAIIHSKVYYLKMGLENRKEIIKILLKIARKP